MKIKLLRILPIITTIIIMIMIFLFSAQSREQSAQLSGGITQKIIELLPISIPADAVEREMFYENIHHIIRKCAHFTIYASLGFSAAAAFASNMRRFRYMYTWLGGSAVCCLYSITDELHQSIVDGRGAMVSDVVLDTFGGMFGAAVLAVFIIIIKHILQKEVRHD